MKNLIYEVGLGSNDVELILGKDRVILRSLDNDGDLTCIVLNLFPVDVLNYCSLKW